MAETERFMLGEIPQRILDEATQRLSVFSTALGWPGELVGGGTFAKVNGIHGILTAAHVWERLWEKRREHPEVMVLVRTETHGYSVPIDYLTPHVRLERKSDPWGPDIEFVELPVAVVERVAAAKSFAEISARAVQHYAVAAADDGFGAVMGFAAEHAKTAQLPGNRLLLELRGGYISGIENHQVRDGFDYVETVADPHNAEGLPKSYGGVSGSGLWKMTLEKKPGAPIETATLGDAFALAGVAFYEEERDNGCMIIRYHGPQTVYHKVPTLVQPK